MLGERKSSMCRSRVARGHFTLMAAGPIEMTAALHDLKVRRQRIIFQWWRRGIGGVKWCLPTTPPLLRSWIIAEQPRWNQHNTKPHQHYFYTQHTMTHMASHRSFLCPYIIMRNSALEQFWSSVCETKQHNKPPCSLYSTLCFNCNQIILMLSSSTIKNYIMCNR